MKIPDDVFETRCCYCFHGRPGAANEEIPDDKLFSHARTQDAPCQIIGISRCREVEGECLSFKPNPMFGICQYCEHSNQFLDGYCDAPGGPVNKRRVYLGWGGTEKYYGDHALFICDAYRAAEGWKDIILRFVAEGRAPANFDPETWEPVDRLEETEAAKRWAELMEARKAELYVLGIKDRPVPAACQRYSQADMDAVMQGIIDGISLDAIAAAQGRTVGSMRRKLRKIYGTSNPDKIRQIVTTKTER